MGITKTNLEGIIKAIHRFFTHNVIDVYIMEVKEKHEDKITSKNLVRDLTHYIQSEFSIDVTINNENQIYELKDVVDSFAKFIEEEKLHLYYRKYENIRKGSISPSKDRPAFTKENDNHGFGKRITMVVIDAPEEQPPNKENKEPNRWKTLQRSHSNLGIQRGI
jgi:hypothetical protein